MSKARPLPVSKTKIVVPQRRTELLSRARLLQSVRASLDHKLILLTAPAGYGKTSLLVDFAHTAELPVCWLSLDPLDRDPQRFLAYLIAALGGQFPNLTAPLQSMLNEMKSIERESETLLVELTNELQEQAQGDFLFVLDDYHLVDDVPAVSGLLNRFVQLAGRSCHIVLSSRTPPSLPDLELMAGRGQVEVLNQAELAFLPREIQDFFFKNHYRDLSDQAAQELVDQTGGWITGIILNNQSGGSGLKQADAYAYLSRQVLDRQPEQIRLFLLRTSLAEEFDAGLCREVLGPFYEEQPDWSGLVRQVLEKNLFVLSIGNSREPVLRYHPLFREFLRERLREERSLEVKLILERLTRVFLNRQEWEKAYYTCRQMEDSDALAEVIEIGGGRMLQLAFTTLDTWMCALPKAVVSTHPGLISLLGAIENMKGHISQAIELLDSVETFYRKGKDISGLALMLVRRSLALRMLGEYNKSLRDADEAIHITEKLPDLQINFAEALRIKGINLFRLGKTRLALDHLERSLLIYNNLKMSGSIPLLLEETAIMHATLGNIVLARSRYLQAFELWEDRKNLYAQAGLMNDMAILCVQTGDYVGAVNTFKKGVLLARNSQHPRVESLILLGVGDLFCELGEYGFADSVYQSVRLKVEHSPKSFMYIYQILARANLAISRGDSDSAQKILEESSEDLDASPSQYDQSLRKLIEGRIYLLEDETQKAISALECALAMFLDDGRHVESQFCRIWLAAANARHGNIGRARTEILAIAQDQKNLDHCVVISMRLARPWLASLRNDPDVGSIIRVLLQKAEHLDKRLPYIRRQLKYLARAIHLPASRLVIQALGRSQVYVDGHLLVTSKWRTQSVRELFFFLLSANKPMTKENIGETMWPDVIEPAALNLRFKNDVYRLRRAIGRDAVIFEQNMYKFNQFMDFEYDVEAFEIFISMAKSAEDRADQIEYYKEAVNLVRGPFLDDVGASWVWPERERLSQEYLAALLILAELCEEADQVEKALDALKKAIDYDPGFEDAYRQMLRIYHRKGDRGAMMHLYERCEKTMQGIFNQPPSIQLQNLYKNLIA